MVTQHLPSHRRSYVLAVAITLGLILLWMALLQGYQTLRVLHANDRFASLPTAVIANLLEEHPPRQRPAWLEKTAGQLGVGLSVVPISMVALNPLEKLHLRWTGYTGHQSSEDFSLYRIMDGDNNVLVMHSVSMSLEFSAQVMTLVRQWVSAVPQAARQARLERLDSQSQQGVSLGTGTPYGLRQAQMARLASGQPEMVMDASGDISFYVMLDDYRWIKVGPYSLRYPMPMSIIFVSGLLLCLVEILVVFYFIRRHRDQIRWLERCTQRLVNGKFDNFSLAGVRSCYLPLGASINQLATHLQDSVNSQQELIRAVSHEFRTPLARVRFALQMISDVAESDLTRRQLKDVDHDIEVLDRLIDEILTYARVDGAVDGGLGGAGESIDLATPLDDVVQKLAASYPDTQIDLSVAGECWVQGDIFLLRRAIHNLIENAAQHAHERVNISLSRQDNEIVLFVDDDGEGVPTAERQRIFKPFTRLDASRSRGADNNATPTGFGIGLAIVERIAYWHQGRVSVVSAPSLGGARFELVIPRGERSGKSGSRQISWPDKTRFY